MVNYETAVDDKIIMLQIVLERWSLGGTAEATH